MNDETITDTTDEATTQQMIDDAFAGGYQGDDEPAQSKDPAEPAAGDKPPEAVEPPAPAPPVPAEPVEDDPFKGLSQQVRDRLAKVDNLDHDLRTANGRIAALQRRLDARPAPAKAAPAPATPSVRETLRGELPEVADALDELEQRMSARQPEPSAPDPTQDATPDAAIAREMASLSEVHPDWQATANSTDFSLWTSAQGQQFADKVRSTSSAVVVADALTKFKAWQSHVQTKASAAAAAAVAAHASRNNRVASAAAAPARGAAPPGGNLSDEDEEERAMAAGFRDA